MEERIREFAEEALEKRLGTYGYVKKDNCYKPYTEGFEDGYKKGLEAKINITHVSDCPLPDGDREAYLKKLLQSDIDKHNKIVDLSRKVYVLQKQSDQLTEAKEIIKLAIKGIKKTACEERCDFVNREFFL